MPKPNQRQKQKQPPRPKAARSPERQRANQSLLQDLLILIALAYQSLTRSPESVRLTPRESSIIARLTAALNQSKKSRMSKVSARKLLKKSKIISQYKGRV